MLGVLGTMTPSGDFVEQTKQALRDGDLDDNIIEDASFLELDVYAHMPLFPVGTVTSELRAGCLSNTLTAKFGEDSGDYALVTDFETKVSGPHVALSAEF